MLPGCASIEFSGAGSFVVFEKAGFRLTELSELLVTKTWNIGKRTGIVKFQWDQKSAPFTRNVKSAAPREFGII